MRRRGFSLTELLVVIGIILLLAALLLGVFMRAKKTSLIVPCTNNLRQIGISWKLYSEAYDDVEPQKFDELIANYPEVKQVILCPEDDLNGGNVQTTSRLGYPVSYFPLFPLDDFRKAMRAVDPNYGIVVCPNHGEPFTDGSPEGDALSLTTGLVLRLRIDGSVERANVGRMCSASTGLGGLSGRQQWSLFSATPCVDQHCHGLTVPCE